MFRTNLWLTSVAGLMLVGCGQGAGQTATHSAKGGIAVIDLDLFSKSVGRTQEMEQLLQSRKQGLDQAILKVQNSFNEQLTAKKKEFGDAATEEQTKLLAAMQREAATKLVNARQQAQADLDKYRTQLVANLRTEVRPYASNVAATKGLGVVIPKNEGFLLSFDPGIDITAEVISAYASKKPASSAVAPPQEAPAPAAMETAQLQSKAGVR